MALATGLIIVAFIFLSTAARGRMRQRSNKDGSFFVLGGSSDSSASGIDGGGDGGGGGEDG